MPKLIFIVLLKFLLIDYVTTSCSPGQYHEIYGGTASLPCTPCPVGYTCRGETDLPVPCNVGTYSPASSISCTTCPTGSYCPGGTNYMECKDDAYYQSSTGKGHCLAVPLGNIAIDSRRKYDPCAANLYRDRNAVTCTSLSAPNYAHKSTGQIIRTCSSGYYIDSSQTTCTICSAGSTCTGTNTMQPCPSNSASPPGASQCVLFPPNYSYSNGNLNSVKICNPGEYSPLGACIDCPTGRRCESPLGPVFSCADGLYSESGKDYCQPCPYGYFCSTSSSKVLVPAGQIVSSDSK